MKLNKNQTLLAVFAALLLMTMSVFSSVVVFAKTSQESVDEPATLLVCPTLTGACVPGETKCDDKTNPAVACEYTCTAARRWNSGTLCQSNYCHGNECAMEPPQREVERLTTPPLIAGIIRL